jgi:hypothetical protein
MRRQHAQQHHPGIGLHVSHRVVVIVLRGRWVVAGRHLASQLAAHLIVKLTALREEGRVRCKNALPLTRREERIDAFRGGRHVGIGFDREIADRGADRAPMNRRQRAQDLKTHLLMQLLFLCGKALERLLHRLSLGRSQLSPCIVVVGKSSNRNHAQRKREREKSSIHAPILRPDA